MSKIENTYKTRESGAAALVFILALIVFLPVLGNGFVNWDDPSYIYENVHIRSFDLRWIFTAVVVGNYHPLTLLSHTIDYALFGLNPMGHHLVNIILHALNSALVFVLARRLIKTTNLTDVKTSVNPLLPALAAALLFAVHPLHVGSIAWASERKDMLSAFFFLLALLSYLRYVEQGRRPLLYALSLFIFLLALLSKPMAITLPVVLLLLDFYPLKRVPENIGKIGKILLEKAPFFALSLASAITTLWAQRVDGALRSLDTHSLPKRLFIAVHAVAFYLHKLILPVNLSPYYPMPFSTKLTSATFIISLMVIILITLLCLLALKKKQKWPITIWAFYLVTLLPVSGLVTVGGEAVANRYAYIPTMGFLLLAGVLISKIAGHGTVLNKSTATAGAILLAALSLLTFATIKQEAIWKGTVPLMSRAIKLYPWQAAIPYNNRGFVYEAEGKLQLALDDYNKAITITPKFHDAYNNRGILYSKSSLLNLALDDFSNAISIDPLSAKAYSNRGAVYMKMGEYTLALRDLKKAVELDPKNMKALYNLSLVYQELGNSASAYQHMRKAAGLGLPEAIEFLSEGN